MASRRSSPKNRLRAAKRSAHASIAGYHYQFAYTALRWLMCRPGDVLYCEGNEDLDHVHGSGNVEEVQLKYRSRKLGSGSQVVKQSLSNFVDAFCEHHAAGRGCMLVFSTTAEATAAHRSLLGAWMSGREIDCDALVVEIRKVLRLNAASLAYLDEVDAWKQFIASVHWKFGAPILQGYGEELLTRLAATKRAASLDPVQVRSAMTYAILERSGRPQIADRALTTMDLDVLLNDIWLAKAVEHYGSPSRASHAYVALSDRDDSGAACVALFLDDEAQTTSEYGAACERLLNLPGGRSTRSVAELCGCDGGRFLSGAGFDAYAIVDTRRNRSTPDELAQGLLPYIHARGALLVKVVGFRLAAAATKAASLNALGVTTAASGEFAPSLASLVANIVLENWSRRTFDVSMQQLHRKLRVVCDLEADCYYTQADPPPWASQGNGVEELEPPQS